MKRKIVVFAVLLTACGPSHGPEKVKSKAEHLAFRSCEHALKQLVKNPSSARIPHVLARRSGDSFRYEWSHGDGLAFQNAFGAMLDTTAVCEIESCGLRSLSLNGDEVSGMQRTVLNADVSAFCVERI